VIRRGLLVVVATALVATGCGGGGGSRLTHEEFVAEANTICKDYNAEIAALGTPQSAGEIEEYAKQGVKIAEKHVGRFRNLKPPPEDAENAAKFVELGEHVIDQLKRLEELAAKNDVAGINLLGREAQANAAQARAVGKAMGAEECAK
jgi:hypothetical protein